MQPVTIENTVKTCPVNLQNQDGKIEHFEIREMSGLFMERYLEDNKDRAEIAVVDGKMTIQGIKTYKGMYTSLLKFCLFDEGGNLVSIDVINSLPSRVQKQLFDVAQEVNGFNEEGNEQEGESGN